MLKVHFENAEIVISKRIVIALVYCDLGVLFRI